MLEMWMCAPQATSPDGGKGGMSATHSLLHYCESLSKLFLAFLIWGVLNSENNEKKNLPQCSEVIKSVILSEPYYWNHLFFPLPRPYSRNKFSGHTLVVRATLLEMISKNFGWHKERQMHGPWTAQLISPNSADHIFQPSLHPVMSL